MARDYKRIRAWQMVDELALAVYRATESFPRAEMFGLTSQMRRAAVSVPANIVEGATRKGDREYIQFLYVALGSLAELGYYISFAQRLAHLTAAESGRLTQMYEQTAKTLRALANFIERAQESEVQSPRSRV